MIKTLYNLLEDYNIIHQIPSDDPLLKVPLELYSAVEQRELLTYLWFYDRKWLDLTKLPKQHVQMGSLSITTTKQFLDAVRSEIVKVMADAKANDRKDGSEGFNIQCSPPDWHVTPAQVSYFIGSQPIFKELLEDSKNPGLHTNVSILMSKKISDIFQHLGIPIPSNLSTDMAYALKMDLKSFSTNSINEKLALIYCLILTLNNWVTPHSSIIQYTYSGGKEILTLKSLIAVATKGLRKGLSSDPSSVRTLFDRIANQFKGSELNMHPRLLAIICFEAFPLFKQFFQAIWAKQFIRPASLQSRALIPLNNRFALGYALCYIETGEYIPISNMDLIRLMHLQDLAEKYNKKSNTDKLGCHEAVKAKFEEFKNSISTNEIKPLLTLANIKQIGRVPVINFQAIQELALKHGIDSPNNCPSLAELEDLYALYVAKHNLDIWNDILQNHTDLNIDSTLTIEQQSEIIQDKIVLIQKEINAKPNHWPEDKLSLRQWWFETELIAYQEYDNSLRQFMSGLFTQIRK